MTALSVTNQSLKLDDDSNEEPHVLSFLLLVTIAIRVCNNALRWIISLTRILLVVGPNSGNFVPHPQGRQFQIHKDKPTIPSSKRYPTVTERTCYIDLYTHCWSVCGWASIGR